MTLPLTLWDADAFAAQTEKSYLGQSLYYGALLALIAYNLLIFLLLRARSFLLYVLCAGSMVLSARANNGLGRQFLWPDGIS